MKFAEISGFGESIKRIFEIQNITNTHKCPLALYSCSLVCPGSSAPDMDLVNPSWYDFSYFSCAYSQVGLGSIGEIQRAERRERMWKVKVMVVLTVIGTLFSQTLKLAPGMTSEISVEKTAVLSVIPTLL